MAGLMQWLIDRLSSARGSIGTRGPGSTLMPHDLPAIFHHWMAEHVHPLLTEIDIADTEAFFVNHLRASAARTGTPSCCRCRATITWLGSDDRRSHDRGISTFSDYLYLDATSFLGISYSPSR